MKTAINDREKGLLVLAAAVVIPVIYFTARIKPQTDFHKAFEEEVAGLERQINSIRLPPADGEDEAISDRPFRDPVDRSDPGPPHRRRGGRRRFARRGQGLRHPLG